MKKSKTVNPKVKVKNYHVANTHLGMGDSYGQSVKNKMGRIRSGAFYKEQTDEQIGRKPKKLA